MDIYSLPISDAELGSAKLSKSNLTNSGPVSPKTPHAKHKGVNEEYLGKIFFIASYYSNTKIIYNS